MNCENCIYFKKGKVFSTAGHGTKPYTTYFASCTFKRSLISRLYLNQLPKKCGAYKEKQEIKMTVFEMSEEALLEQLIEECGELVHAAAKRLRILRKESPTPVIEAENKKLLTEEATDVKLSIEVLCITGILNAENMTEIALYKYNRWKDRLAKMEDKK